MKLTRRQKKWAEQHNATLADVIAFSGCRDEESSADASVNGKSIGALNAAIQRALNHDPDLSYIGLLAACRTFMKGYFSQIPQLTTGYPVDLTQKFTL